MESADKVKQHGTMVSMMLSEAKNVNGIPDKALHMIVAAEAHLSMMRPPFDELCKEVQKQKRQLDAARFQNSCQQREIKRVGYDY